MSDLRRRDRINVEDADGNEVEVFNWLTIKRTKRVRATNPTVEAYEPAILAGDGGVGRPDAVTHWVANELHDEEMVDVEDHGIDVIDPTDDEVTVL